MRTACFRKRTTAVGTLCVVAVCFGAPRATRAQTSVTNWLQRGYPHAFFFRSSEGFAAQVVRGRMTYEQWDDLFGRLGGIMGKTLEEEVPGRSANIPIFTRFKREHPEQLVLLHYNGNARDPRDGAAFAAGHWIYFNGSRVTRPIPATPGECDIYVEDASLYQTGMGRYRDKNEDVGLCRLDDNGRPDWSFAEQVVLLAVDRTRNVLRVRRGCFGTQPRAFDANRAYAAAHVTEGPWGKQSNLLWYYNYATCAPRDARGRSCADVLIDDLKGLFVTGGVLAAYDGLEFDVLSHEHGGPSRGNTKRGLDVNADGVPDWGRIDGTNTYGIGVDAFCRGLRIALGENRLIMADGANPGSQRAFASLNGIESEGWPHLSDWEIRDWSGGMNRHRYWARFAHAPVFNYINHKYVTRGELPGTTQQPEVPFNIHRLVFGAAQMFDAVITYAYPPRAPKGTRLGVWDELWQGTAHRDNWLGQPRGDAVCLARRTPELLSRQGCASVADLASRCSAGPNTRVRAAGTSLVVDSAAGASDERLSFRLAGIPAAGPDLLVIATMRAEIPAGTPRTIPRLAHVGLAPDAGLLVSPRLPEGRMQLRGGDEQPLDGATGAAIRYARAYALNGERHDAYMCHPPHKGRVGATLWSRIVTLPEDAEVTFFAGLSPQAETRSDGVTYSIRISASNEAPQTVFSEHIRDWRWTRHTASLKPWSGRTVTLTFIADCGPADNCTTDHAHWGDVYVGSRGVPPSTTAPEAFMTLVGDTAFASTFYFRDVAATNVALSFDIEGAAPWRIERLEVFAHPEAMLREFDRGLVLVNPAHHPYTFALGTLCPGGTFKRLAGSPEQDPRTNDGAPVGATVTLPARDGLFLVRE